MDCFSRKRRWKFRRLGGRVRANFTKGVWCAHHFMALARSVGGAPGEVVAALSLSDQVDGAEFRDDLVECRMQTDCFCNFHAPSLTGRVGH